MKTIPFPASLIAFVALALVSVVQALGAPNLTIRHLGNTAIISWPYTGSYIVQQNSNLALSVSWATSGHPITTNSPAGSNSITIAPPVGNLYFRLANP